MKFSKAMIEQELTSRIQAPGHSPYQEIEKSRYHEYVKAPFITDVISF